jgi:hypothetical protein
MLHDRGPILEPCDEIMVNIVSQKGGGAQRHTACLMPDGPAGKQGSQGGEHAKMIEGRAPAAWAAQHDRRRHGGDCRLSVGDAFQAQVACSRGPGRRRRRRVACWRPRAFVRLLLARVGEGEATMTERVTASESAYWRVNVDYEACMRPELHTTRGVKEEA